MFSMEDLAKHKAFKRILDKSKIEITGDAAIVVASLFQWYDSLYKKFDDSIKNKSITDIKKKIGKIKPISDMGSVKKIGDK